MPKEYIITDQENRTRDELGGPRVATLVGWSRGVQVQLATVIKAGAEGSPSPMESEVDQGVFLNLDRDSLNRLIRTLRKARDQAFGQDA